MRPSLVPLIHSTDTFPQEARPKPIGPALTLMVTPSYTGVSVLYTGDFNTTPDRHLGPAHLPPALRPDLLITESTYANSVRESKRSREREFLMQVHTRPPFYHPNPGPDPNPDPDPNSNPEPEPEPDRNSDPDPEPDPSPNPTGARDRHRGWQGPNPCLRAGPRAGAAHPP